MPQCHNSHPKLLQHQRCKSWATHINKCNNYHMAELPTSPDVLVSQDFGEKSLQRSSSNFPVWRALSFYLYPNLFSNLDSILSLSSSCFSAGEYFIFIFILFFSLESILSLFSSCFQPGEHCGSWKAGWLQPGLATAWKVSSSLSDCNNSNAI